MVPAEEALHVVIPSWRGEQHLKLLLQSLAEQTCAPAEVLIVDGGSEDKSQEVAQSYGARFLNLGENRGFAHAVRQGVAAVKGQRVAVLNNDLRLAPDWIEQMQRVDAPFVVGKVLAWDQPTRIDATWDLLSRSGIPMRAGHGKPDGSFWSQSREINLAPWTAIVLRRDYWQATGGLDESFESYLEDVDIGMRGLRLGFRGRYEPAAVCWHRGSATLGAWHPRQVRLSSRNQLRLIARHSNPDWWRVLVGQGLWGIAAARHGCLAPWWQGKWEALRNLPECQQDGSELKDLEAEIFGINAETGFDRFWQWYWTLAA
jgi:GT2 family glycosyltransferase